MDLKTLVSYLPFAHQINNGNPTITTIEMDSREVKEGSLFICVKGFTVDGHQFVPQAIENGAAAILAEEEVHANVPVIIVKDTKRAMAKLADFYYGQPTQKMNVIGVTGTNGKTTITHILERIFQKSGEKTGLIGTINMKIGNEIFEVHNTTPESLLLQKTFAKMVDANVSTAMMEVSSHALDLGRVRGCDFDIAIFTNLTQDHLDYHHSMDEYRYTKGLLFAQLGNQFVHSKPKYAILNADDTSSVLYEKMTSANVMTYGIDHSSDVMAKNIQMTNHGTRFVLISPIGEIEISMKLIGKFSVYNVLASAGAAIAANVSLEIIKESIESLEGVPGRFEVVNEGQPFTVIVDYAHTPDSLENVLTTINQFASKNVYTIVGCGGDRDRTKRPLMAEIASRYSHEAILTSDNPRTEDPLQILKEMEEGISQTNYTTIVDRKEAIHYAIKKANKDDVVLIAGKGHETYQIVGNDVFDFDDRLKAIEAIKEKIK